MPGMISARYWYDRLAPTADAHALLYTSLAANRSTVKKHYILLNYCLMKCTCQTFPNIIIIVSNATSDNTYTTLITFTERWQLISVYYHTPSLVPLAFLCCCCSRFTMHFRDYRYYFMMYFSCSMNFMVHCYFMVC